MPNVICGCGKNVETKPEWAGQWISCPGCNGTLYAPFPGDRPAPPIPVIESAPAVSAPPLPPPGPAVAQTRLCPWCAETIPAAATSCPVCKGDARATPARPVSILPPSPQTRIDDGGVLPLVIGIFGFMFCQLAAPVAWALGSRYEKDCAARGMKPNGMGTAGKILGIVGTVMLFLVIGFLILASVIGAATSA